jgi:hypothetical protein
MAIAESRHATRRHRGRSAWYRRSRHATRRHRGRPARRPPPWLDELKAARPFWLGLRPTWPACPTRPAKSNVLLSERESITTAKVFKRAKKSLGITSRRIGFPRGGGKRGGQLLPPPMRGGPTPPGLWRGGYGRLRRSRRVPLETVLAGIRGGRPFRRRFAVVSRNSA